MKFSLDKALSFLILVLILSSCGTKREIVYIPVNVEVEPRNYYSDIVLNYKLEKKGLADTLNYTIQEAINSSSDMLDYDIKMLLTRPKSASIEMEGKSILVTVPVGIILEKKTFLTDFNARGIIEMSFISDIDVDSSWTLKTKTLLSYHRWIEKPKLSFAGLTLPIEMISNAVLKKLKVDIEESIDQSIIDNFTLRQKMTESLKMFDEPMQLDKNGAGWLNIKPEQIRISKVRNSRFSANGKLSFKTLTSFTTYKPTAFKVSNKLPEVVWNDEIPDSSLFRLVSDIKMMDINAMIKDNLDGKTFKEGNKSITLSNIVSNCDYEHIRVVTDVAGSINGTLILIGKPKYDENKNLFYMDNIDVQLRTKNVIHKAAAWLAEGKIRKEIEAMLKFPINDYIIQAQKNINNQIKELNQAYNMEMKVNIGNVNIESFELKPGQIEAVMKAMVLLELRIHDFQTFSKF